MTLRTDSGNRAAISKARWARQRPGPSKPGSPHGSGLGVVRWVVERILAWLPPFRRLALRYERRADAHEAFLTLGCALITWRNFFEHSFRFRKGVLASLCLSKNSIDRE